MSDFFARLAARTLGAADTVRPVVAPMFAAPDPVADDPWPEEAELETPEAPWVEPAMGLGDPATTEEIEAMPGPGTRTERAGASRTAPALEAVVSVEASDEARPVRRTPESGSASSAGDTAAVSAAAGARPPAPRPDVMPPELVPPQLAPISMSRNSTSTRRAVRERSEDEPSERVPADRATDRTGGAVTANAESSASTVSTTHASPRVPPPLVRLAGAVEAVATSATLPPASEPAPLGPTIKITIGRVEVRATPAAPTPAAAPRRERAEQPTLSLSDYLKGGGQR